MLDGVHAEAIPAVTLTATYFDTDDLRLARWGGTLRFRSDEGWSVKLPAPGDGDLLEREEIHFDGRPGTPPPAAQDLVTAIARRASLIPVVKLRTRRKGVRLHGHDGSPLAEVVDDEVSVLDGRKIAARFREIEIELAEKVSPDVAAAVRARLESAGAGRPDPTPKHVRALGPRAATPPQVGSAAESSGEVTPAVELVSGALSASTARLIIHDPRVRLGLDPEDVHQARVATRRLRADLRTFRTLLDPDWTSELRAGLRWLGGELGAVRDKDVLVALLRGVAGEFLETERRAAERLLAGLEAEEEAARERLLASMRSDRYVALLDRLVKGSNAPSFAPGSSDTKTDALIELGARPWKKLQSQVKDLQDRPDDDALHRVRILTKRSRYAAEALAPIVGRPARAYAKAAASLQDVLGRNQDASVAREWLRSSTPRAPSAQAFAAGMLVAAADGWSRKARTAWPAAWRRLEKKRVPSWS